MKKQLFSLHEQTVEALDRMKSEKGVDKSAFVDALISRELAVELPETAIDRRTALNPEPASIEGQIPQAKTVETPQAASQPSTAFETPPAPSGEVVQISSPLQDKPVAKQEVDNPVEEPSSGNMPIVEPVLSAPPATDTPPASLSERVCETCGEKYDTPYCLNCLV